MKRKLFAATIALVVLQVTSVIASEAIAPAATVAPTVQTGPEYSRKAGFEWEAVQNASEYEVEIIPKTHPENKFIYKTKDPVFQKDLTPGIYQTRLRSKDSRGVAGPWSPVDEFTVGLEAVKILTPTDKMTFHEERENNLNIDMSWSKIPNAHHYHVEVAEVEKETMIKQDITDDHLQVKLPVGKKYVLRVSGVSEKGDVSETTSTREFEIAAGKLSTPVIQKPTTEFVRDLYWSKPVGYEYFDVHLSRYNKKTKQYDSVSSYDHFKGNNLPFDQKLPGGFYRLQVTAQSSVRASSDPAALVFKVKSGDRTEEAEEDREAYESIQRHHGWRAIAAYWASQITFQGSYAESRPQVAFTAITGTGRLGLAYDFGSASGKATDFIPADSPWGVQFLADYGGVMISSTNVTFSSYEADLIYNASVSNRADLRIYAGVVRRENPEVFIDSTTSTQTLSRVKQGGLHGGLEYWYSLNSQIGFQLNYHMYPMFVGIETPNGQGLYPSTSYQYGFMGSYKLRPQITGLIGFTHKVDQSAYNAATGGMSLANPGDVNRSQLTGEYLNLLLEWGF